MIVVFLHFLLFFLPYYIRLGVVILTIIGYGLVCGLDSSVFRAVIMGGMSMIALFWGREIDVRRLLSRSCIMMLVINPYFLAYDSGFLLSYSALIGIIYFDNINKNSQEKEEKSTINPPVLRTTPPFQKEDKKLVKPVMKLLKYAYKSYLLPSV